MAFLVEDGTGVANANSYVTVDEADTYFTDRRKQNWVGSDADKQAALIAATDYIEQRFGLQFLGCPEFDAQTLSFPRTGLVDPAGNEVEGIPLRLKQAQYEYALCAMAGELFNTPTVDATGLKVTEKKVVVGPIETTTKFDGDASISPLRSIPQGDAYLMGYIGGDQAVAQRA